MLSPTPAPPRAIALRSVLLTLYHPHLVKTNEVWSVPGYIVINMELADATLLDLMLLYHNDLGQHIDAPQLCRYMWQVAEALDFLNARKHTRENRKVGFQHGDVKPNNILLIGETAKLTDHGLATPTHGPVTPCPRQGTREYAAPEIFAGHYSDTSDQYSLAVTTTSCAPGRSRSRHRRIHCRKILASGGGPRLRQPSREPSLIRASCRHRRTGTRLRDFMTDILHAIVSRRFRSRHDQWLVVKNASRGSSTVTSDVLHRTPPPGSSPHKKL